ncbi:peptidoglycan DD-metalloendopeptidase family protein [Paracoccus jiaweipingae]|uniref:peptidoglycan DD-metalloendopeptidase family protein n=1 Tax=unclassified Paracoccus (in: a-proteobacteria) TaxID=2688777 RepID=UPI00379D3BD9
MDRIFPKTALGVAVLGLVASCAQTGFDVDLRRWGPSGFDTAGAAAGAVARPTPDARGVISYPNYQVVVARQGETVASIASRLGLNASQLARHNAIAENTPLTQGAIVALNQRVPGGTPARPATATSGGVSDPFAGQGILRPGARTTDAGSATSTQTKTAAPGPEPRRHSVQAGETGWSVARKYGVSIQDLAQWNGLPTDMSLRVGQTLLIPVQGQKAPSAQTTVTAPGSGSPTPRPPSAAEPLPKEKTQPAAQPVQKPDAPDLGATRTAASGGRFAMPVAGAIIRPYTKGRNEGIDISAPSGTPVKAAGSGTVAAITRDVDQVPIVVIRHSGGLMTVYAGLDNLKVKKGDSVSAGQAIGASRSNGVVHFEVRQGFESVDPEKYL